MQKSNNQHISKTKDRYEGIRLSVLIPAYNVEAYIGNCLDSILSQDYEYFEIIIVDDGSTDETGKICDIYAIKDNRIKVIHNSNNGVSNARNTALKSIIWQKGSLHYVIWVDSDDRLPDNHCFSIIAEALSKNKCDMLIYNFLINGKTERMDNCRKYEGLQIGAKLFPRMLLGNNNYGCSLTASLWRIAFSLDIIRNNNIGFREDIRKAEDTLFCAKFISYAKSATLIDNALYNYIIRPNSLITTYRLPSIKGVEKGLSILEELDALARKTPGLNKNDIDQYLFRRHISICVHYFRDLCDSRGHLSLKQIYNLGREPFDNKILLNKLSFKPYGIKQKFPEKLEWWMVKNRQYMALIVYAKLYHYLKKFLVHDKN